MEFTEDQLAIFKLAEDAAASMRKEGFDLGHTRPSNIVIPPGNVNIIALTELVSGGFAERHELPDYDFPGNKVTTYLLTQKAESAIEGFYKDGVWVR